jgi:outer membrane usher protein
MSRREAALTALLLFCAMSPARAAPLLLEVWRNGATDHAVVHVTAIEGALLLPASEFNTLGIKVAPPPGDEVDLTKLPGITVTLDDANQRLLVQAAAVLLPRQLYDLGAGAALRPAETEDGAILRYDLSATLADARRFGRTLSGGGTLGLDVFRDNRRFTTNGFATLGPGSRVARLDTALTLERPETLTHLTFGDAITVAPSFGRALRYAGVQYASDFSLAPGLVTMPLPSFFGASDVPATVDIYSGAVRLAQQDVAAGPFEIRNLPAITGGGEATVVVRDVQGRQTTQSLSLFLDKGLLAAGREAFAIDLGFRRGRYGFSSFDYRDPVISADWRRGLDNNVTVQAHGEASPRLAMLGGGGEASVPGGILSADLAASTSRDGSGLLAALSARFKLGRINLYGMGQATLGGFRDLASLDGFAPPRWRVAAGAAADLDAAGMLALSWIGEKRAGIAAQSLLTASWSLPLGDGISFAATALHDFNSVGSGGQIALAIPVGPRGLASLTASADRAGATGQALYDNPADPDGGFGYRLAAGRDRDLRLSAEGRYVGQNIGLGGGVALSGGAPALRADAAGALVLLRGSLFATRDPGEALALVETGAPDIRIYRENRPVSVSDANGRALLTGLAAYAPNHIAIEARDYPFDTVVEKTELTIAPRRRGAALVDLSPPVRHPLIALVTRGADVSLPAGARVVFDGEAEALALGHDGRLFVADLQQPRGAMIDTGQERCRVFVTPVEASGPMPQTPPLTCFREPTLAY